MWMKTKVLNDLLCFSDSTPGTLLRCGRRQCGKLFVITNSQKFSHFQEIDGVDIREINLQHLPEHMALVGQEPTLFNLEIGQNIAYGLENATEERIVEAAKLANIHDFINSLPKVYSTE